jgi:signal transduction histidine kinase
LCSPHPSLHPNQLQKRYNRDGSFGHTRCFIRDDTQRKVREARARLLLEETKRSLKLLDNFMSRTLHHLRTPLHVVASMCEVVAEKLADAERLVGNGAGKCLQEGGHDVVMVDEWGGSDGRWALN